jgi:hypothetical protein
VEAPNTDIEFLRVADLTRLEEGVVVGNDAIVRVETAD